MRLPSSKISYVHVRGITKLVKPLYVQMSLTPTTFRESMGARSATLERLSSGQTNLLVVLQWVITVSHGGTIMRLAAGCTHVDCGGEGGKNVALAEAMNAEIATSVMRKRMLAGLSGAYSVQ